MLDDVIRSVVEGREHAVLVFQDWYEEHKHEYKLFKYTTGYAIRPVQTREMIRIFGPGFDRTFRVNDEANIAKYTHGMDGKILKARIMGIARAGIHLDYQNHEYNISLGDFIRVNRDDELLKHLCAGCDPKSPFYGDNEMRICFNVTREGLPV